MSMMGLVVGLHDEVADALEGTPGGYYREEDENGVAVVPSWWMHSDSSARLNALQDAAPVYLDVWAEDRQEISDLLEKVEFLREHEVLQVGTYRRQSIAVQDEDTGEVHATLIVTCTHFPGYPRVEEI